mmetsp:Transcript_5044/g.11233  ORF Transcript_5044/g.11233 Transcript_5044/m.11233 type:complete len:118 (-) Transcript_5044:18-371(-)
MHGPSPQVRYCRSRLDGDRERPNLSIGGQCQPGCTSSRNSCKRISKSLGWFFPRHNGTGHVEKRIRQKQLLFHEINSTTIAAPFPGCVKLKSLNDYEIFLKNTPKSQKLLLSKHNLT